MKTLRRRQVLVIISLLLASMLLETSALRAKRESKAPVHRAPKEERIKDEYIVRLRDDLSEEEIADVEAHLKTLIKGKGMKMEYRKLLSKTFKGFTAEIQTDFLDVIRWLEEVDYVEEDQEMHLAYEIPWGLDRIDQEVLPLDSSFKPPLEDGSGINVFVVDSGILYSHNEFSPGRAKPFFDTFEDGRNGEDCGKGHGTHVAGIIGGKTVGVAPGVTLYSARVFDCQGKRGTTSRTVSALDAIMESNITPGIVSMSITGGKSVVINDAVERLADKGYIVIAAAGNDQRDACLNSPASAPLAITVGATTEKDSFYTFSNFGPCVDILAPGKGIESANSQSNNAYVLKEGTSMACPHVTGVAARMLHYDPKLTREAILTKLLAAAGENLIDMSAIPDQYRSDTPNYLLRIPPGKKTWREDLRCGAGYLNEYNEVAECDPHGENQCCGADNYCGNQPDDCTCATCADYRPEICSNSCNWSNDGECDDGGQGASYSGCNYGTDCADCGSRPPVQA
ncbi:extracellular serine proteinase-like [Ptychodera flava]|uniref:extracellular serine proteinase-like n=1 Tax=Ptychodera flava TaxID=63121 RepID=UPI003969C640